MVVVKVFLTQEEARWALIAYKSRNRITQAELAHRIGYNPALISRWLNRKEDISVAGQIRIDKLVNHGIYNDGKPYGGK